MSSRPHSRIYTCSPFEVDNQFTNTVQSNLNQINPRAFAADPPLGANINTLKTLNNIILLIKQLQTSITIPNSQLQMLIQIQFHVRSHIYNHFAFLLANNWVPR